MTWSGERESVLPNLVIQMQFYILVSQLRFPSNAGALIEYMSVIYFHFEFVKGQTRLQKMTKLPKYISTGNFHDFLVNLGI